MNNTYSTHSNLYSSGRSLASSSNSHGQTNFTPRQALKYFFRQRVDERMILYLIKMTEKIIKVQEPTKSELLNGFHSLYDFIEALVKGSNVQTPTLMATTIYLRRLSKLLPSNVIGISTTRHRMFVGCLIITSKNLNDSSPLNKHWKNYCLGMLSLTEINTIEREILELFNWKLEFDESELIESLGELLMPQTSHINNSATPSNSYASAYSTTSSNSLFSHHQKTMTMSSRISNLSNLTDYNYEQYSYNQQQQQNNNNMKYNIPHDFYKQYTSKSESNLIREHPIAIKYNPTPPIISENPNESKNVIRNSHLSNSDSLLNVDRILNNRDQQRMRSSGNNHGIHDSNISQPATQSYRIQHPHFQVDYL